MNPTEFAINHMIGNNIRKQRLYRGWGAQKLAHPLALSVGQLSQLENGTIKIPAARLVLMSVLLECELAALYQGALEVVGDRELPEAEEMALALPAPGVWPMEQPSTMIGAVSTPAHDPLAARLLDYFERLRDPLARNRLCNLVQRVVELAEPPALPR